MTDHINPCTGGSACPICHPEWAALRAENEELRAEVRRLAESESLREVQAEAELERSLRERERLRAECVRLDEANTGLGRALVDARAELEQLRAELERARPVLDKARAWRRWYPHHDSMFVPENELMAAVDAHRLSECVDETADGIEEDLRTDGRLPVCVECGHRHRWVGECADHSWGDSCPYNAGADCDAGHTKAVTDDEHPERTCKRCGGPNVRAWVAPSPLWNQVMRGGDINTPDRFSGIVCPVCFAQLAEEMGVARLWRFYAEQVKVELANVTPSGRVWNPHTWLWEDVSDIHRPTAFLPIGSPHGEVCLVCDEDWPCADAADPETIRAVAADLAKRVAERSSFTDTTEVDRGA